MQTLTAITLALCLAATSALARGGGGCFEEGTPVLTPTGEVPIEQLHVGDAVVGGHVVAITRVEPLEYLEVSPGVRVTAEHPFQIAPGIFRTADRVFPSAPRVGAHRPAYNLLVSPGGTFVAAGFVVHNKGCFLPDTPILRADGTQVRIRDVRAGDELLAFTADGQVVPANVRNVLTHDVDEYLEVATERTLLRVTVEHPFYVGDGTFKTLEALGVGDTIYAYDAGEVAAGFSSDRSRESKSDLRGPDAPVSRVGRDAAVVRGNGAATGGHLTAQPIVSIAHVRSRTRVYNLQVDEPNTFFANGIAVHNKGGGGGGGFHGGGFGGSGFHGTGGGGSGDPTVVFLVLGGIVFIIIVAKVLEARQAQNENLDYSFSSSEIASKADKTRKLLGFIAKVDAAFQEEALQQRAMETFVKLQECWQAREYGPMQPLLMPDLYAEHCAQLQGMRRNHEIDMIGDLKVERVDIVNVRYGQKENDREFTGLITASARDYYVDDRTNAFLRGDEEPARFQEFWTFQRQNGQWLLREIEQSRESDKLKEESFFEPFTDKGVEQVYGKTADQEGPAGPWLEKSVETKATKIDHLLNFLVQTDKLWDRQAMLERARQVFTHVMLAREAGDPTAIKDDEILPAVALDLRQHIGKQRAEGLGIEYRNLCVRKVELILVRNFSDNSKDEYTVRISAHAQKIIKRAGAVVSQDEDVTPFAEYWTFGRFDGQWKLKEVLPPSRGEEELREENVDEDSNAAQLQWYYQHKRAN
jgi:predicted lipid-binding transport protein (Tim44 family)